jgi:hypothetical protein
MLTRGPALLVNRGIATIQRHTTGGDFRASDNEGSSSSDVSSPSSSDEPLFEDVIIDGRVGDLRAMFDQPQHGEPDNDNAAPLMLDLSGFPNRPRAQPISQAERQRLRRLREQQQQTAPVPPNPNLSNNQGGTFTPGANPPTLGLPGQTSTQSGGSPSLMGPPPLPNNPTQPSIQPLIQPSNQPPTQPQSQPQPPLGQQSASGMGPTTGSTEVDMGEAGDEEVVKEDQDMGEAGDGEGEKEDKDMDTGDGEEEKKDEDMDRDSSEEEDSGDSMDQDSSEESDEDGSTPMPGLTPTAPTTLPPRPPPSHNPGTQSGGAPTQPPQTSQTPQTQNSLSLGTTPQGLFGNLPSMFPLPYT